jgi:hypothetical protein
LFTSHGSISLFIAQNSAIHCFAFPVTSTKLIQPHLPADDKSLCGAVIAGEVVPQRDKRKEVNKKSMKTLHSPQSYLQQEEYCASA